MKTLLPLAAALSIALPAQAQTAPWPVRTTDGSCRMSQTFQSEEFGRTTLTVEYNAAREEVTLTTTNPMPEPLSDAGQVQWRVVFLDNGDIKLDEGWPVRTFDYTKANDRYRFSTAFAGQNNVRQLLADLAASRSIGFMRGGKLITAYELEGADASIARLRDCATRAVAAN